MEERTYRRHATRPGSEQGTRERRREGGSSQVRCRGRSRWRRRVRWATKTCQGVVEAGERRGRERKSAVAGGGRKVSAVLTLHALVRSLAVALRS